MRLLVTNDDGINAPGLDALVQALRPLGEIVVIAPDRERSATAHGITLHKPLRVEKVSRDGVFFGHAVSGTPVDCVKLALVSLLETRPDFVVAGVNPGTNIGTNAIYSGTVAAAIEGAMNGVPSLAVSIDCDEEPDYTGAATFAARFITQLAAREHPRPIAFNINLPDLPADRIKGVRLTHQGRLMFREEFHERTDPQRRTYYWLGGKLPESDDTDDASGTAVDSTTVRDGTISVTPIHCDLTDYRTLEALHDWSIE